MPPSDIPSEQPRVVGTAVIAATDTESGRVTLPANLTAVAIRFNGWTDANVTLKVGATGDENEVLRDMEDELGNKYPNVNRSGAGHLPLDATIMAGVHQLVIVSSEAQAEERLCEVVARRV